MMVRRPNEMEHEHVAKTPCWVSFLRFAPGAGIRPGDDGRFSLRTATVRY